MKTIFINCIKSFSKYILSVCLSIIGAILLIPIYLTFFVFLGILIKNVIFYFLINKKRNSTFSTLIGSYTIDKREASSLAYNFKHFYSKGINLNLISSFWLGSMPKNCWDLNMYLQGKILGKTKYVTVEGKDIGSVFEAIFDKSTSGISDLLNQDDIEFNLSTILEITKIVWSDIKKIFAISTIQLSHKSEIDKKEYNNILNDLENQEVNKLLESIMYKVINSFAYFSKNEELHKKVEQQAGIYLKIETILEDKNYPIAIKKVLKDFNEYKNISFLYRFTVLLSNFYATIGLWEVSIQPIISITKPPALLVYELYKKIISKKIFKFRTNEYFISSFKRKGFKDIKKLIEKENLKNNFPLGFLSDTNNNFFIHNTSDSILFIGDSSGSHSETSLFTLIASNSNNSQIISVNLGDGVNIFEEFKNIDQVNVIKNDNEVEDRLNVVIDDLLAEADERRKEFRTNGYFHIDEYEEKSQTKLTRVILHIDCLEKLNFSSSSQKTDTEKNLVDKISRLTSCTRFGIIVVATVNNSSPHPEFLHTLRNFGHTIESNTNNKDLFHFITKYSDNKEEIFKHISKNEFLLRGSIGYFNKISLKEKNKLFQNNIKELSSKSFKLNLKKLRLF